MSVRDALFKLEKVLGEALSIAMAMAEGDSDAAEQ
eukprot:gene5387-5609_t